MSCFFMPMHPMYVRPMMYAERRRSCSPCGLGLHPLFFLFLVLFAPCLIRTALFLLAPLLHVGFVVAMVALSSSLFNGACTESESEQPPRSSCDNVRSCFAKMAAAAKHGSTQCPDKGDRSDAASKRACGSTSGTAAEDPPPLRKRDLSSVRFEEPSASEAARVLVACPGVAAADLNVSILPDGEMHIRGATTHVGEVFAVDRRITLSRALDPESAECSHADGMLTVTLKRKAGKRIVVNAPVATAPAARDEEAAEHAESSEGEWVEPAAKEASAKKDE